MDYKVTDTELTSVADAIRTKGSTSAPLEWPDGFAQAVIDLPSGGSSLTITVYTAAGADVTVTNGAETYTGTADADGHFATDVSSAGTYTVSAYDSGELLGTKSVNVVFNYTTMIGFDPSALTFANCTADRFTQIIQMAHSGTIDLQNDLGWAVGDTREITMNGTTQVDIVLSSFADYENCGNVLQFDFLQQYGEGKMNNTDTNVGGYGSSKMKTDTLPSLVSKMPQYLQDLLLTFDVKASAGNASSTIVTVSNNKLALRSEKEVCNTTSNSYAGEGTLVTLYETSSYRIKPQYKGSTNTPAYWTRSPRWNAETFAAISFDGASNWGNASWNRGIAPFGCL